METSSEGEAHSSYGSCHISLPSAGGGLLDWGGGGAFVGWSFGAKRAPQVAWGLEGYVSVLSDEPWGCVRGHYGGGPLLRLHFAKLRPRVMVGGHFGANHLPVGGGGELGVQWGQGLGIAPHLGLHGYLGIGTVTASYAMFANEGSLVLGAAFPRYALGSPCIYGRPLRSEEDAGSRLMPKLPTNSEETDAFATWTRVAQEECDAIGAFLQLFAELDALDAPEAVLAACLAAAEDELRHARDTVYRASEVLGRQINWPTLPEFSVRPGLLGQERTAALAQLAEESVLDGMLGEGAAVSQAAELAQRTTDRISVHWNTIAREESRHAELAGAIVSWAMRDGGDGVHTRLETILPELSGYLDSPVDAPKHRRAFGLADAQLMIDAAEVTTERVQRDLKAALSAPKNTGRCVDTKQAGCSTNQMS